MKNGYVSSVVCLTSPSSLCKFGCSRTNSDIASVYATVLILVAISFITVAKVRQYLALKAV